MLVSNNLMFAAKAKLICLLFLMVLFSACKKQRDCECITTSTEKGVEPITEIVVTEKIKKKDAKSECNLGDFDYRTGDPVSGNTHYVTRDCSPK